MINLPEACLQALRYYTGDCKAYPGMPQDPKAYCTINSLFYTGINSEYARGKEGKPLNPELLNCAENTLSFCCDLMDALQFGGVNEPKMHLYRVARETDVAEMRACKHTVSFTSTSKNGFLESYTDKSNLVLLEFVLPENGPRADMSLLLPDYTKPEEAEVLLPPWLPLSFQERGLTEEEEKIRDKEGNKPLAALIVTAGTNVCYPEESSPLEMDKHGEDAGKRVFSDLVNNRKPNSFDESLYIQWKSAFIYRLVCQIKGTRLIDALQEALDQHQDILEAHIDMRDMFKHVHAVDFICKLLGVDRKSLMGKRIQRCSEARLLHTVTTYLLGYYIRENLALSFDKLPRIFSSHTTGNAFSFFWSLICLCHDIGYEYERMRKDDRDKMICAEDRRALLELQKADLLTLNDEYIKSLGMTDVEEDWAKKSIILTEHYNLYRIQCGKTIDHGIAGALLVYDHMMALADASSKRAHKHSRNLKESEKEQIISGELVANSGHSRFRACCLLIALTIARHNMWVVNADKPDDVSVYQKYKLQSLIVKDTSDLIGINDPLDQMLFWLDFLDTIDPVKHFYVRIVEADTNSFAGITKEQVCKKWKEFLLQNMRISCRFKKDWHDIRFTFGELPKESAIKPPQETLDDYFRNLAALTGWLNTQAPIRLTSKSMSLPFPCIERTYKGVSCIPDITDEEILALCLYGGCADSVRPSRFYQTPNAYQTFNLLLMEGLIGERVRIGMEHQRPYGLYIRDWQRTQKVLLSVFSAQCKYLRAKRNVLYRALYRADREANTAMMVRKRKTFAFTSTSKARYLKDILDEKKNPTMLEMTLTEPVPLFDFQEAFGSYYAYTEEAEVLLPPYLSVKCSAKEPLDLSKEEVEIANGGIVKKYKIAFGGMSFDTPEETEKDLLRILNSNSKEAARILDEMRENPENLINMKDGDDAYENYISWKKAFQKLLGIKMFELWNCFNIH